MPTNPPRRAGDLPQGGACVEDAVLILGHHNLQRRISQIVLYTGGQRRSWDGYGRHPNGLYCHDRELGYLKFRYAVVDAGEPNDSAFHRHSVAKTTTR
jgi:hypothetical protein